MLLLPAGSTPLIHFHQTLGSNFLTRDLLAGLRGLKRSSTLERAFLPFHKSDRPLCFIYFSSCAHPPVPSGLSGGDAESLLNPRSMGNRVICGHANHEHPFGEVPVECGSPRDGCQTSPPCYGCQCSQGAGPAWHRDWEERGRSFGRASILAALSHWAGSVPLCPVTAVTMDHQKLRVQMFIVHLSGWTTA